VRKLINLVSNDIWIPVGMKWPVEKTIGFILNRVWPLDVIGISELVLSVLEPAEHISCQLALLCRPLPQHLHHRSIRRLLRECVLSWILTLLLLTCAWFLHLLPIIWVYLYLIFTVKVFVESIRFVFFLHLSQIL
jgi:hypothetical protein